MTDKPIPFPSDKVHRPDPEWRPSDPQSRLPSLARKQPAIPVDDFAAELVTLRIDITDLKLRISMLEKPR
jgi:hypothetical protein